MTESRISRRSFLQASALTTIGAFMAACTAATAPAAGGGSQAAPSTDAITLRLWHWDNFMADPWLNEGKIFTESHPNITVVAEMTPYDEYSQKMDANVAGDSQYTVMGTVY